MFIVYRHISELVHESFGAVEARHIDGTIPLALAVSPVLEELDIVHVPDVETRTRMHQVLICRPPCEISHVHSLGFRVAWIDILMSVLLSKCVLSNVCNSRYTCNRQFHGAGSTSGFQP